MIPENMRDISLTELQARMQVDPDQVTLPQLLQRIEQYEESPAHGLQSPDDGGGEDPDPPPYWATNAWTDTWAELANLISMQLLRFVLFIFHLITAHRYE